MTPQTDTLFQDVAGALAAEYELLRPLGYGGMATVYLARERALKRLVAIKVLDPELGAMPVFRARFEREVETAAQLQHPHIVPIHRVGEIAPGDAAGARSTAFYVMAYVEGESLADRLKRDGQLPVREALRIAAEVVAALGAAHRRGIIHRDVKPQNILLERESGRALVTDFGIAGVAAGANERPGVPDDDRLTGMGMVMGTPRYMSPEQASGVRDLAPASDLYALGVVLYEMLCGAFPYRVGTPPNFLVAHLTQPVIPLVTRVGDMPREVEGVVARLLDKEPERRFASTDELAAAIARLRTDSPPARRAEGMPFAVRHAPRGVRIALWVAAIGALLGGLVLTRGGNGPASGVDPRQSILVGFFQNTTRDADLEWLRIGGVEYLAQALDRWAEMQVVDAERLLDLARRNELAEGAPLSQEDALALARSAGVWTATVGSILKLAGDTLALTVRVYDVADGRLLTTATAKAAGDSALPAAFNSLASQILRIAGAPAGALLGAEPPTKSIEAYRTYIEGIEARSRWDIPAATAAFGRAIEADPGFALAYYELSQARIVGEMASRAPTFVPLADSALRYAADRPVKERLLIEAYNALVHADFARARELYSDLLGRDSTLADAWSGLGSAAELDLTLRRDARGREYLPASFATALRSYERALALDASDHRIYPAIARLLMIASIEQNNVIPAYREPPPGDLPSLGLRVPARFYTLLATGDSLLAVPADSVDRRFPQPIVDSLRATARSRARGILERWIRVAPDEGQAYLYLAALQSIDEEYAASLQSLAEAERLGAPSPVPYPLYRLGLLLQAKRVAEASRIGDSLLATGDWTGDVAPERALVSGAIANYLLVTGRPGMAARVVDRIFEAVAAFEPTAALRRVHEVRRGTTDLRLAASAGRTTQAQLESEVAELERQIAAAPEAERRELRYAGSGAVSIAASSLGDTALVRAWREVSRQPGRLGYDAWAAAAAGDTAGAVRLLARVLPDTARNGSHAFAIARAAELSGNLPLALEHYGRMDSLPYEAVSLADPEWLLLVRSYLQRAAIHESLGDEAAARRYYRRVLEVWQDPDEMVRPLRGRAARALGALERADRSDRPAP